MKYCERFENAIEFGKYQAQKRLNLYKEYGEIFYNGNVKINLLAAPDWTLSETMRKQKQKSLDNIEELKKVVNGEVINVLYTAYFNAMKNNEWGEWKN